jgi:hypothetical protein
MASCLRCGRTLSSAESKKLGYGPTCFAKELKDNPKLREQHGLLSSGNPAPLMRIRPLEEYIVYDAPLKYRIIPTNRLKTNAKLYAKEPLQVRIYPDYIQCRAANTEQDFWTAVDQVHDPDLFRYIKSTLRTLPDGVKKQAEQISLEVDHERIA